MSWLEADATGPVVSLPALPVFCNALYPTRDEALSAARGDLEPAATAQPDAAEVGGVARAETTARREREVHVSGDGEHRAGLIGDRVGDHPLVGHAEVRVRLR